MVKIRYASCEHATGYAIIKRAIANTSAKFDNNIIANRFEQTTSSTYEVTIKCVSSRGNGAKRGASGRRTQSCCWHVWCTFFDELFKLNPRIVVVAQGRRITRESGNWVVRTNERSMCDCEANGWVRETPTETFTERVMEAGRELHAMAQDAIQTTRRCDASCRHNSANNDGVVCHGRNCVTPDVPGWEPVAAPTVVRSCHNCRHCSENNATHTICSMPCDGTRTNMYPDWELYTPPPGANRVCTTCRHSITYTDILCPLVDRCGSARNNPLWEEHTATPTRCADCAYSQDRRTTISCPRDLNGDCLSNEHRNFVRWVDDPTPSIQRHCCDCEYGGSHATIPCNCSGLCLIGNEHRLFRKFVKRTCETCKHNSAHNAGVSCYTVVGLCGAERPKWKLYAGIVKQCSNCKYSYESGCDSCYKVIGSCSNHSKWKLYEPEQEGFNPDLYLQQPQVMPQEKGYMGLLGGE